MNKDFRKMSIAETLADKSARNAFAMATGFSLDFDLDRDGEKSARRARYARRKQKATR